MTNPLIKTLAFAVSIAALGAMIYAPIAIVKDYRKERER